MNTLREIAEDPLLSGRTLPTRLQVLAQRMARHGWTTPGYPQEGADHESEEGQEALLRNAARPSSESEAGPKPAPDGRSEEHTSELQSLMRISSAVSCLKKKTHSHHTTSKHNSLHTRNHP